MNKFGSRYLKWSSEGMLRNVVTIAHALLFLIYFIDPCPSYLLKTLVSEVLSHVLVDDHTTYTPPYLKNKKEKGGAFPKYSP